MFFLANGFEMSTHDIYEIRLKGHLSDSWTTWLEGLTIQHLETGVTILCGPITDQAALHGVLMKIRDLGLPLLEVKQIHESKGDSHLHLLDDEVSDEDKSVISPK